MRRNSVYFFSLFSQALLISHGGASDHQVTLPKSWVSNITNQLNTPLSGQRGRQNFTHCCASALNTLESANGSSHTDVWVDTFSANSQYPCGATYQGDSSGAPAVHITYGWCHQQCPGWQISDPNKLTQWLQPLVGFILPAVIFSLNVPRQRKFHPPTWVFPKDIEKYTSVPKALWCASNAAVIVTFDTIVWLCFVFALAGPLLISGLYEAWIDKRVVDYMSHKNNFDELPLALRSRILIAVLVGNLDLNVAWMSAMNIASPVETSAANGEPIPEQIETQERELTDAITSIQKRISSMLACQYSFGSTIGAPIVFYIGSFIYALLEIRAQLGDNDTSHALAFGMWWMTIPHIAIVSCCLLAGNNPNTLEAIVPLPSGPSIQDSNPPGPQAGPQNTTNGAEVVTNTSPNAQNLLRPDTPEHGWLREKLPHYGPTYDAHYQPKGMIDRGRSKREWLFCLIEVHERRVLGLNRRQRQQLDDLRMRLNMKWGDWLTLIVFALLLFIIPCAFGFLVAYLTPQIGLSCRSFTVLMYATSQFGLLMLWLWDVTWRDGKWRRRRNIWGARVYSSMLSPNMAEAVQDQTVQTEPTANGADPSQGGGTDTGPDTERHRPREMGVDQIPMVLIPSTAILAQRQGINNTETIDQEAGTAANRHASDAGTMIPKGLFLRTMSFLAKAKWIGPDHRGSAFSRLGAVIYGTSKVVLLLLATFSAIGGTLMQIIGVYRTCLCQINVYDWLSGRDSAGLIISTNTSQDILLAHQIWIRVGITASVFLGVIAYIAWWYQRRLRFRFSLLLGNDYMGVFNNEMRRPGTTRQSTENSQTADTNEAAAHANQPVPNGAANGTVHGITNGHPNFTAHGGVIGSQTHIGRAI